MTALCKFCDQEFNNLQAVRAHLKGCEVYRESKGGGVPARVVNAPVSKGRTRNRTRKAAARFSRADRIQDEVAALEARLQLRQVEAAHRDLDQEERRFSDRELADQRMRLAKEQAARQQEQNQKIEAAVRAQRRAVIQGVRAEIIRRSVPYQVSSVLQAEAIKAIEKDLAGLPVDELPRSELLQIAEGARDRAYQPAIEEERKSQEREERRSRESLERMGKIRKAVEYAQTYLKREVSRSGLEDEVGYFKQSEIVQRIEDDLETEFEDGNPSAAELRETVEDLVSDELDAWTGDDEDADQDADQDEEE